MTVQEIRRMSGGQLHKQLAFLREQLRHLKFKTYSKEVKNNHQISQLKKDIARILTVLNQI